MQNIFKSRKLTKDKFTLISSKVVPSSSTCDDSSLSELCCSPPPYKNILLINCLILLTIFHKSLFFEPSAHLVATYPGFLSIKWQKWYHPLLPWMGCQFTTKLPLPAFHQASLTIHQYPFILLDGDRHCESKVFCPRT